MARRSVSVIVPVYGIERYLGRCVESILCQAYGDIEVVLVDDGSPDRCPELCDLYAHKDPRVRVVHKPNGGLVSARKAGLLASEGRWVGYVDGDDWVGPGFVGALVAAAEGSGADVACAGWSRDLFGKREPFSDALPAGVYEGEGLRGLWSRMVSCGDLYRPGVSTYVWNKLFRREVLEPAQLAVDDSVTVGEDAAVTYPALLASRRVVLVGDRSYRYRQREGSMLKARGSLGRDVPGLMRLHDHLLAAARASGAGPGVERGVRDLALAMCVMRAGGELPGGGSVFGDLAGPPAVYSAGTFGQQVVGRMAARGERPAAWVDDDFWEYRRLCMDVDPVESLRGAGAGCVLVASVSMGYARAARERLAGLGVDPGRVLSADVPEGERDALLAGYFGAFGKGEA